jgi:hypothetical protein
MSTSTAQGCSPRHRHRQTDKRTLEGATRDRADAAFIGFARTNSSTSGRGVVVNASDVAHVPSSSFEDRDRPGAPRPANVIDDRGFCATATMRVGTPGDRRRSSSPNVGTRSARPLWRSRPRTPPNGT